MKLRFFTFHLSLFTFIAMTAQTVSSPDGNLKVNLSVNAEGTPVYNVTFGGVAVIEDSPLGMATTVGD